MPSKVTILVYESGLVFIVGNPQDTSPWKRADMGPLLATARADRDDLGEELFLILCNKEGELPIAALCEGEE